MSKIYEVSKSKMETMTQKPDIKYPKSEQQPRLEFGKQEEQKGFL